MEEIQHLKPFPMRAGEGNRVRRIGSAKAFVVLLVCPDPMPQKYVTDKMSHRAVVIAHAHRPHR